jgi:hypothetical protein
MEYGLSAATGKTRWLTSRKVFTLAGIVVASTALFTGKMSAEVWVYAMAVFLAGHHAADLIRAWRGHADSTN